MYLTLTIFLKTNQQNEKVLSMYHKAFHNEIEKIIHHYEKAGTVSFYPYRNVSDEISFYSKNQVIHFAEILYEKRKVYPHAICEYEFSLMAKSFHIDSSHLVMNFGKDFMRQPLCIDIDLHDQQSDRIRQGDIVKLDIKKEKRGYFAKIMIIFPDHTIPLVESEAAMGVDIGMLCPAVCYTSTGVVKFIGNGRQIRFYNRKHQAEFKRAQKNHKRMEKFNHKISHYKNHIDHCISKAVIDFALSQDIQVIKLENLKNLQQKFKRHDQICWSYKRLQTYIAYKAELAGIKVIYINPHLTSKQCPHCGKLNNVKSRTYLCSCGFRKHRDIVGAMNILNASPEVSH